MGVALILAAKWTDRQMIVIHLTGDFQDYANALLKSCHVFADIRFVISIRRLAFTKYAVTKQTKNSDVQFTKPVLCCSIMSDRSTILWHLLIIYFTRTISLLAAIKFQI
jgi:hypothetical protein